MSSLEGNAGTGAASHEQYTEGHYWDAHDDFFLGDSAGKVQDIQSGLLAVADRVKGTTLSLADVGAGVGGVLVEAKRLLLEQRPGLSVRAVAFEVSPRATAKGRELYPDLDIRTQAFGPNDGPFDAVMLMDVLEHVENPWELLRNVRLAGEHLIVRQPLAGNYSTFRNNAYRAGRESLGHIQNFNYYSFLDLTLSTGWEPLQVELSPFWSRAANQNRKARLGFLKRLWFRANPTMASFFMSGFYLLGAFRRTE